MWKDIKNWEKLYEVNEDGEIRNYKTKKLIKGDINNCGYYRVKLYNGDTKKTVYRHRAVAEAFIPNPNHLPEINHIDGNKSHNYKTNLEWSSRTHNEREAHRLNIKEYKPFEVKFINGTIKKYEFAIQLANELNVTKRTVLNYLQKKSKGFINHGIIYIKYLNE